MLMNQNVLTSSSMFPYKNFQSSGVHQYFPYSILFFASFIASGSSAYWELKFSRTFSKPNVFIRWRYWDSCPEHYRKTVRLLLKKNSGLTFFHAPLCSEMSILKSSPRTASQRVLKVMRSSSLGDLQGLSPEANFWSHVGTTIPENPGSASLGMGSLSLDGLPTRTLVWSQTFVTISTITREINQITLLNSLEVFPLIGLDSAASLSRESSSSLKFSGSSGAVSFRFSFRPFSLFFGFKFPTFVAMLWEAVIWAFTVRVWPLAVMDSEPATEPESVVWSSDFNNFLPANPDLGRVVSTTLPVSSQLEG